MDWSVLRLLAKALWLGLVAASAPVFAAEERIVIIAGGIDKIIYLPVALASRLGYFRDQGLDVEIRSHPAGVEAEDVLLTGAAQGVAGFYDHTIELQARGKAYESVVQLAIAPGQAEVVAKRHAGAVRSPADLAGKRLGVTGLGSSTNFISQYLVASHGLKRADVTFVPVGAGDTFIEALRRGRIDAGMTSEPTVSRLLGAGDAEMLVDLRTPERAEAALGGPYPSSCLYMPTAWVNAHRPQVQKLVNALVKALRYIRSHGADEIAASLPADYYGGDRSLYVRALDNSKAMFTADGVMPGAGPPTVLRVLSAINRDVRGKAIDLTRTYTTEFAVSAR